MAAKPLLEETGGAPDAIFHEISVVKTTGDQPGAAALPSVSTRRLAIYSATDGFDLVEELDHLCARTIESNVFFNPRFLAPAMPRLEDREVRLAVIRDDNEQRSRLRLQVPFTIENPPIPLAVPVIRSWSNPFGPLGTPLVDHDNPAGVVDDFLLMLARRHLGLPKILVLPETHLDGPFATVLKAVTEARNLPLLTANAAERAFLAGDCDGDTYLRRSLRAHHLREFRRLKRRLGEKGRLTHQIARQPDQIRNGVEIFLTLEGSGWKGRARTAMVADRYQAAFAREAMHRLAERDLCRVHTLFLDDDPIACILVLVESGIAYTWKTTYDEDFATYSPGTLLMIEVTRTHLEDPNIVLTDSCAVSDHPVMNRLWSERRPIGTFIIGLVPGSERLAHRAAGQIQLYHDARGVMRNLRRRVRSYLRR